MYKLTIIAVLAFASMAFVESGDNFPTEQKEKHDNQSKGKEAKSDHGNKPDHTERVNVAPPKNDQHGDKKGNKGGGNQGGSFDQGKKGGHGNEGKQQKQHDNHSVKQDKGHGNKNVHSSKKMPSIGKQEHHKDKGHGGKMHYEKGHPNFGYVYVNNHGYYSHSNYGQWRSREAKKKHKHYHPIYEIQAIEGFNLIIVRNQFLFTETDYKINLIRVRLAERRTANLITVIDYDRTINRIAVLEQRRAALEINIVL